MSESFVLVGFEIKISASSSSIELITTSFLSKGYNATSTNYLSCRKHLLSCFIELIIVQRHISQRDRKVWEVVQKSEVDVTDVELSVDTVVKGCSYFLHQFVAVPISGCQNTGNQQDNKGNKVSKRFKQFSYHRNGLREVTQIRQV